MHIKRLLTALIGLPLFILLIAKGSTPVFTLFISLVSLVALQEYLQMVNRALGRTIKGIIPFFGFIAGLAIIWSAHSDAPEMMLGFFTLNLIFSGLVSLIQAKSDPKALEILLKQVVGLLYIPIMLSYLVLIRNGAEGIQWLFFLFSVVFGGDAMAYYAGTFLGRNKLIPFVSPGKTVEGSIAGIVANLGVGLLAGWILLLPLSRGLCLLLAFLIGIAAQVGDLFESQLKRAANLKDSGALLPGHGGVLDRIDATLFAAPVLYLFKEWML